MKNMKKILALVVAALMIASMATAFAATVDTATIDTYNVSATISNVKSGNTVNFYRIAAFKLDTTTNAFEYQLATGLPAAYDSIDELAALSKDGYTFTPGSTAKAAADTLANAIAEGTLSPLATISEPAGSGNSVTKSLPAGWYVVTVSGTADTSIIYQNMIINALPKVDSTTNTYVAGDAVSFEVKHTTDTITKGVGATPDHTAPVDTTDAYSVGDTVPYEIKTNIPNYPTPSKVATFKITDTPTYLTDDVNSIVVKVGGETITAGDTTFTKAASGDGFIITFAKSFILQHPGAAVVVNYNAVIKSDAVIAADGETATNTAKITFNPNPNETGEVEPDDTTKDYTYGIYVHKYDSDDNTSLTGAEFSLTGNGNTYTGTTTDGYLDFKGLEAGTYTLTETKAPAGYKLREPASITIVIDKDNPTVDGSAATFGNDPVTDSVTETNFIGVDVPNTKGTSLPSTGGMGTTLLYIGGSILVLAAAILLVTKRRMSAND